MRDSVPYYARRYTVQLDTAWVSGRDTDTLYRGFAVRDGGGPKSAIIGWSPGPGPDSVNIVLIGLGGIGWRLRRSADSLAGSAYEYDDAIEGETSQGPASAHRSRCDR